MNEKDLLEGITKEHILKSIETISKEGFPPHRRSNSYDLVHEGMAYPPKYVLSLAGYFRDLKFIRHKEFKGGEKSVAFAHLKGLGFTILPKAETVKLKKAKENPDVKGKYLADDNEPEFFDQNDMEALRRFPRQRLDRQNPEMESTYQHLRDVYKKVEYWTQQVLEVTFPQGVYHIKKKPTNQAAKFEFYLWSQIYPTKGLKEAKALAFTLTLSAEREDFCVKIDTVGLGENDPIRKKYLDIRGDFFESPLVKTMKVEDILSKDWEYLISESVRIIKDLESDYNKLLAELGIVDARDAHRYSIEEMQKMFGAYLERVIPGSARDYLSAIPTVNKIAIEETLIKESIYELQNQVELEDVIEDLKEVGAYREKNNVGHNKFSSALSQYRSFIAELNSKTQTLSSNNTNMEMSLNTILYGPPGTGKTYNSIDLSVQIANGSSSDHKSNKEIFDKLRSLGQIEFITFHQNYTYEDFVVGIKPDVDNATLRFSPHKGIFYQICKRARDNYQASVQSVGGQPYEELIQEMLEQITDEKPLEFKTVRGRPFWLTDFSDKTIYLRKSTGSEIHTLSINTLLEIAEGKREIVSGLAVYYYPIIEFLNESKSEVGTSETLKNYVLVIDEINRANISKVFGELITLLEDDKRLGQENELRVSLPNGEKDFAVPPNLYIIGTMNTADKSIALLDIALRRRFEFIGKYPDYQRVSNGEAKELLQKVNTYILDKKGSADYLIGHAYFMNYKPIADVLKNKIIPLLSEYFMGKNNLIEGAFVGTGWDVKYNKETYSWDITKS